METNNQFRTPFRPEGFDFAGQDALQGVRCLDCGERFFPLRSVCLACSGNHLETIRVSTRGKIYSYTVIHRAPAAFQTPYGCGWVLTDDGIKIWAMFKAAIEKLRVGLPMEMTFDKLADRTIYYFKPTE
ncbi:MAG: OB-fold domain-containing protein [Chloroflexi bacterium]|nr:OB-fold domain-containing protein [Chloroflexota bacterium]